LAVLSILIGDESLAALINDDDRSLFETIDDLPLESGDSFSSSIKGISNNLNLILLAFSLNEVKLTLP
jgi:hypothetical protein